MTPTPIRLDPNELPPPHGPDHADCTPCDRMRRQIGHVPLSDLRRRRLTIAKGLSA